MREWINVRRRASAAMREHRRKVELLRSGQATGDPDYDLTYHALRRAGLAHDPTIIVLDSGHYADA
jgi:hypothetical protein